MNDLEILLKLQRNYTDNEVVAYQAQEIKNLQIEIGVLKSTIAELEDSLKEGSTKIVKINGWAKDLESERINELMHQVKSLQKALEFERQSDYKKEMEKWRDKYIALSVKKDI